MDPPVLIFVGVASAVGVFALVAFWMGKKRTEAWQETANQLDISFVGENNKAARI